MRALGLIKHLHLPENQMVDRECDKSVGDQEKDLLQSDFKPKQVGSI